MARSSWIRQRGGGLRLSSASAGLPAASVQGARRGLATSGGVFVVRPSPAFLTARASLGSWECAWMRLRGQRCRECETEREGRRARPTGSLSEVSCASAVDLPALKRFQHGRSCVGAFHNSGGRRGEPRRARACAWGTLAQAQTGSLTSRAGGRVARGCWREPPVPVG